MSRCLSRSRRRCRDYRWILTASVLHSGPFWGAPSYAYLHAGTLCSQHHPKRRTRTRMISCLSFLRRVRIFLHSGSPSLQASSWGWTQTVVSRLLIVRFLPSSCLQCRNPQWILTARFCCGTRTPTVSRIFVVCVCLPCRDPGEILTAHIRGRLATYRAPLQTRIHRRLVLLARLSMCSVVSFEGAAARQQLRTGNRPPCRPSSERVYLSSDSYMRGLTLDS
jgi:hypothetical protein